MLKRGELTVYNLWVHDERTIHHDLVINPDVFNDLAIGDLVEITLYERNNEKASQLLLKVAVLEKDMIAKQLQISIAQNIATQFQMPARSLVTLRKITEVESISVLEIAFRDQYIGRSDMWQLKNSLIGNCVYVGKKVTSLGVRGQIKGIYLNGVAKLSGYVSEQTRPIFRSETAKYFIFIQMSKEMWEFDEDGEIVFEKGVHVPLKTEFIKFQRDVLQMQGMDGSTILMGTNSTAAEGNLLEAINLALNPFDKHYIDRDLSRTGLSVVIITASTGIFEVEKKLCRMTTQRMIDNGISLDLVCLSKPPLHSVPLFKFLTKNPRPTTSHTNSYDPSFDFGPLSLSIATRSDRSMDRDVYTSRIANSELRKQEVFDYLYTDDEIDEPESYVYMIPDWVDCSFWSREKPKLEWEINETSFKSRCKMYEVQMLGLMDMESKIHLPYLDIFTNVDDKGPFPISKDPTSACIAHDESIFKIAKHKYKSLSSLPNEEELDNALHRFASPDSHGNSSRSTTNLTRFSVEEPERKLGPRLGSSLPKGVPLGSSLPKAIPFVSTANDRWVRESSYPDKQIDLVSKFRKKNFLEGKNDNIKDTYEYSKYSTSREPITIVNHHRSFQNYRNDDHKGSCSTDSRGNSPVTESQRLFSKGTSPGKTPIKQQFLRHNYVNPFQRGKRLKTAKHADSRTRTLKPDGTSSVQTISISKPYYVCLGDHVHKLFYDASGNNVEVKRYTRVVKYNREPIDYTCEIWYRDFEGYMTRTVSFAYPALSTYNWNYLDHLITGNQDQMTDALRFWRIRFLLIPTEAPPSFSTAEKLDDEEERLVGFAKFMEHIEKARYHNGEDMDANGQNRQSLDIQLTTLNLSSLVASENVHSLLPEAFTKSKSDEFGNMKIEQLSKKMSFESIAVAMKKTPPDGLCFQDRHWHNEIYVNVITGAELVDWILKHFEEVDSREAAIDIGNYFIDGGLLEHAKQRHKLLDGFYFYKFCRNWEGEFAGKADTEARQSGSRFQAVKQLPIDMDPYKKSSRPEMALLHYDTTHNTKNCYHFQLHWLVCTARLVEDMLHSWGRSAEKCGFKLVECPGVQASEFGEDNPFQALRPIKLSVLPPHSESVLKNVKKKVLLPSEWFKRELVRTFNFVLDTESDSSFPPNSRGFSYQRKPWPNTQYVHRSGIAFVQILPNDQGFLWVNNRLLLASNTSKSTLGTIPSPDLCRKQFEGFCADSSALEKFWISLGEKLIALTSQLSDPIIIDIYDINSRTLLLKFQKPDRKEMLLLESGVRIHTTNYVRNKEQTPSGFNMKLRKHLRSKRLNSFSQLGHDRRIDMEFGEKEYSFHLIIEFFAAGNIILTDHEYRILSVLRNVDFKDQDSIQVGNVYSLENIFRFKPIDGETLYNALTKIEDNDAPNMKFKKKARNLRNLLRTSLGTSYGPALIDFTIANAGLDPNQTNLAGFKERDSSDFQALMKSFAATDKLILDPATAVFKGFIINESSTDEKLGAVYDEFHPFFPAHMKTRSILEYDSFNSAVDEFFSKVESQKLEQKARQAELHAIKKIESVKQNNLNQIKNFQLSQEEKQLKAAAIEMNLDAVESAIQTICSFVASGMDWIDLQELIKEEKGKGNPLALIIAELKLSVGMITLELPHPNSDSDQSDYDSDDSSTPPRKPADKLKIDVDIYQSAYANARGYYTAKKVAVEKEKKTILASTKAIDSAEKKIMKNLASKESKSAKITKYRSPMWFEKFLWFISTENYLVIGGRDDTQNELLVTKYMQSGDVYVHSDLEGSCSVIVKALDGDLRRYASMTTLIQAAAMCMCNSKAWDSKIVTSAFWVKSNQVTKKSFAGDSMPLGKFRILGEKNFLPATQLIMGVGLLFEIETPNATHQYERRPWANNGTVALEEIKESFIDVGIDLSSENRHNLDGATQSVTNNKQLGSEEDELAIPNDDIENAASITVVDQPVEPLGQYESNSARELETETNESQVSNESIQSNNQLPAKAGRGKKGKLMKIKNKYADQDEEDKEMMMNLLGSAKGPQPKGKKAKAAAAKAKERTQFENQKEKRKSGVAKIPNIVANSATVDIPLINYDLLTSQPNEQDIIINCLPVCAPWTVLQKYQYKLKITPGSQKRGKAAKQVSNALISFTEKQSSSEICTAIKSIPEQEWINVMFSRVKVGAIEKK
ncbi:vacuolar membrane-associated protein iml1 [Terramyces sp. JEL0728]|nr:vacuolar membrane-associated protein iml1 [Terramyces sp. JEL0728]